VRKRPVLLIVGLLGLSFLLTASIGRDMLFDVAWLNSSGLVSAFSIVAVLSQIKPGIRNVLSYFVPLLTFLWSLITTWMWAVMYLVVDGFGSEYAVMLLGGGGLVLFLGAAVFGRNWRHMQIMDLGPLVCSLVFLLVLTVAHEPYRDFWAAGIIGIVVYCIVGRTIGNNRDSQRRSNVKSQMTD